MEFPKAASCSTRMSPWRGLLGVSCAIVLSLTLAAAQAQAKAQSVTFGFTGGQQEFQVPTGVYELDVSAVGGHGGSTSGAGGAGALVNSELSVTPGETLYIEVGGNGTIDSAGWNGGGSATGGAAGGGGASDIRTSTLSAGLSPDDRLLVAAGGGGAGVLGDVAAGAGGAAGMAGETISPNEGGGPGTQESGGTAGSGHCASATPGSLGTGGTGGYYTYSGGGGGGGYYGGGGGGAGCSSGGAGGGGGSSLLPPGSTLTTTNTEPQIQINYTQPTVSSVSPDAGLQSGGTKVTLSGTYLATVTQVKFGSDAVGASCTETECTATAPPGDGVVNLIVGVTGAYSTAETANQFTYVAQGPGPSVSKLSAKKGPAAGGTAVTITGSAFTGVSAVRFGASTAAEVRVLSPTSISVVSPSAPSGTVYVTVTTPNGTSTLVTKSRFKFGAPTVTALNLTSGSEAGGAEVEVTGSGFIAGAGATSFSFGSAAATSVLCSSTTSCTMVSPPAKRPGTVDVRATADGAKSKKNAPADQFTYTG